MVTTFREAFKVYDIRGIVSGTLTNEATYLIGKATAAKAAAQNVDKIALGRDGCVSGPELTEHIQCDFTDSGIDVFNADMVAIPMLYYAAVDECGGSGVMIIGSHNPPGYNDFKMMLGGDTLAGPVTRKLLTAVEADRLTQPATKGSVTEKDIFVEYRNYIIGHVKLKRPMKIIIDTGSGVGDAFAGTLYCALGNEVTKLPNEVDGTFSHHHPDPSKPRNLQDLIAALKNNDAEIGLAFNDDADRLGVVAKDGSVTYSDRQLMLFSQGVLSRNPGAKVVFDVKSTRLLAPWIKGHGSGPIIEKTGHGLIKSTMKKTGALIVGEIGEHVFLEERWFGLDDGMYAGVCLLEILSAFDNPTEVLDNLPQSISTPELNIDLPEDSNGHQVIEELATKAKFEGATGIITIDSLRVELSDGFGPMRASNTTSILVLRFEADSGEVIGRIQNQLKAVIESDPTLKWPLQRFGVMRGRLKNSFRQPL